MLKLKHCLAPSSRIPPDQNRPRRHGVEQTTTRARRAPRRQLARQLPQQLKRLLPWIARGRRRRVRARLPPIIQTAAKCKNANARTTIHRALCRGGGRSWRFSSGGLRGSRSSRRVIEPSPRRRLRVLALRGASPLPPGPRAPSSPCRSRMAVPSRTENDCCHSRSSARVRPAS
jgi:hypothetical protein